MRSLSLLITLLLSGCLSLVIACNPGNWVNRGMGAHQRTGWSETGAFSHEVVGTHEGHFMMAEGQIALMFDEHGREIVDVPNSIVTAFMRASPSADEAGNAMNQALASATQMNDRILGTTEVLMGGILSAFGRGAGPPHVDVTARLDAILESVAGLDERLRAVEERPP